MLSKLIDHLRNRDYMSGVQRDNARVKATGEVFTPTPLVQEILDQLPLEVFTDPTKTFLDPACGDGQFLAEVVIRKCQAGAAYHQALATVYGVDLMPDNCVECIRRLYGVEGEPTIEMLSDGDIPFNWRDDGIHAIFRVNGRICNIVCGDGLKYDYSFGTKKIIGPGMMIDPDGNIIPQLFTF